MNLLGNIRKEIGHGGIVPHGWQLAWYEPRRRIGVYYPTPLNWLLRAFREMRYRLRVAMDVPGIERAQVFEMQRTHRERQRLAEEYAHGYASGWRECFRACLEVVEEELDGADQWHDAGMWLPIERKRGQEN
ncbi:MAG: hypothetical protein ACRD59_15315 [Candidatus Acidiferrales bacterium]